MTSPAPAAATAGAPAGAQGRGRAGNAMARTRAAVLLGARQCVISHGSKTTMVDIAVTSGVAKATLYNHFRTKPEVFAALVEHEITSAAADTAELAAVSGLAPALTRLAERLGEHPVVRKLAATEPGILAGLLLPEQAGIGAPSWQTARVAISGLVGPGAVELLLRYLVSQLLWPTPRAEIGAVIGALLAAATTLAEAPVAEGEAARAASPSLTVPGLGYPTAAEMLERVAIG